MTVENYIIIKNDFSSRYFSYNMQFTKFQGKSNVMANALNISTTLPYIKVIEVSFAL